MSPATLAELVEQHAATLERAGVDSPRVDAELLACHVTGLSRSALRTAGAPAAEQADRLAALVRRRAAREPLQHLTGEAWFRELTLSVRPGVFVPRPETEVVAGLAIDAARAAGDTPVVVDLCTGTGAIALAVATEVPGARVTAVDRSPDAAALARHNLAELHAGHAGVRGPAAGATVEVLEGDLYDALPDGLRGHVDVLVSNPPYLPESDRGTLAPEVDADPETALYAGPDGLEVVHRLLADAHVWLRRGGTLVLELDPRSADRAVAAGVRYGLLEVSTVADLTGTTRALVARRP
ncbi:MAG: peptide chain release factor N(5)-glutamine methyltransferase [Actinomycetes bacterium]